MVWQELLHYLVCQDVESLSCKTPSWQGFATSFGFSRLSMFSLLIIVGTQYIASAGHGFVMGFFSLLLDCILGSEHNLLHHSLLLLLKEGQK